MTPQEKLLRVAEIVDRHKQALHKDVNFLEATAFYIHNQEIYEKMLNEIDKILTPGGSSHA